MKSLARYFVACVTIVLAAACVKERIPLPPEKTGFEIVVRTGDASRGAVTQSHETAEAGTVITVSATPIEGYVFDRWTVVSGGAILHPTANPARFTMPAKEVEVAAEFAPEPEPEPEPDPEPKPIPEYKVVVSSDAGGSVVADKETAPEGDQVKVYAVAALDYLFTGWMVVGGDLTLEDAEANPLTLKMPAGDIEIKAVFVKNDGFGVTLAPTENGAIEADKPSAKAGETVTLTATPKEGFAFSKWIVTAGKVIMNTAVTPTQFTMPNGAVRIGAEFVEVNNSFEVTVESDGHGVAQADVAAAREGDEVTLTATPFAGYAFSKWTVESGELTLDDPAANPLSFAMPAEDIVIKAEFVEAEEEEPEQQYAVSVSVDGDGGSVVADRETASEGGMVKIFAIPSVGYLFDGWTAEGLTLDDPAANPLSFAMPAGDVEVSAKFVEEPEEPEPEPEPAPKYTVGVTSGGNGSAQANPEQAGAGDEVVLTATADEGYAFEKWVVVSGGAIMDAALNPTRFTMPARGVEIRAQFAALKVEHAITLTPDGNGSAVADRETARQGERIKITAEPSEGYVFGHWTVLSGDVTLPANSNPATFTMPDGAVEIGVEFAVKPPDENPITVTNDGNGDASASTSISKAGIPIYMSATPNEGYEFLRWVVTEGADAVFLNDETDPEARFIMPAATVGLRAEFVKTIYPVTVTNDGNGTAQADKSGATMQEQVTLSASPDPGYEFLRWVIVAGDVTDLDPDDTFTMPIGAVEIKAEFVLKTLYINVSTDGKGTASPDKPTAKMGETIQLTAAPRGSDYLFHSWKVLSGGVTVEGGAGTSFVLGPDDVEVVAQFVHVPREPFILHLDSNGRLAAGQWADTATQDNLLFFQLGGLVGVTTPSTLPNGTLWTASRPMTEFYNPSPRAESSFVNYYTDLPMYHFDDPVTDISRPEYNTDAMARAGKGDPCRLIGLTAEEAREMAAAGTLAAYNSGFRMPASAEMNADYVSGGSSWATVDGMGGRWRNSAPDASTFLPAAGNRNRGGGVDEVGAEGAYWTANGINQTRISGNCLYFSAGSNQMFQPEWAYGFTVRCVRK